MNQPTYPAGYAGIPYNPPPPAARVIAPDILAPGATVLPGANPDYRAGESPYPIQNIKLAFDSDRSVVPLVLENEGDWLWFMDNTDSSVKLRIRFDRADGPYVDLYRGGQFAGVKFRRLFVFHDVGSGVTGELMIARQYAGKQTVEVSL
jgi:hypothetical protein